MEIKEMIPVKTSKVVKVIQAAFEYMSNQCPIFVEGKWLTISVGFQGFEVILDYCTDAIRVLVPPNLRKHLKAKSRHFVNHEKSTL